MGTLVLTHNINAARKWILQQGLKNPFILSENEIALNNINKFSLGFLDINYSSSMVDTIRTNIVAYKSNRPLLIVMDMRHQTAVNSIPNDTSILFYDGSKNYRLQYHPTYTVDFIVSNPNIKLADLLSKSI